MAGNTHTNASVSAVACYHCGENCKADLVHADGRDFCCDGCRLVYDLLKENSLCTYYNLNANPGVSPGKTAYSGKYDYLNQPQVSQKLIRFKDGPYTHITFYLPKIHCSSCIWLLENLHRLNAGILSSSVNFMRKEVNIIWDEQKVKLSDIAELLMHIGYEPLINLEDLEQKTVKTTDKSQVVKIGIAGFCFGNIMMLSFPEYFSFGNFFEQSNLSYFFAYLNLGLSLPVFFYSASGFFVSAWKSIRHQYLNIDAPIALAILVTFLRSIYEILSHSGAGYMDSMTGIVFFMLIGRYFQNSTYETLSFELDYKSYFPVGVSVKKDNGKTMSLPVSELKKGDRILIRNKELVPSDAILLSSQSHIDYSFITGESAPVKKVAGEMIYAGGQQLDGLIELEVVKPTSQSYLTQLWNKDKKTQEVSHQEKSYIDHINQYFTLAVLSISLGSALFWLFADSSKALNALTAVLIVACPCGLLLTSTFAHGNILRILGRNKFYLKNAGVIDQLAQADTFVFDKTGTITHGSEINFVGQALQPYTLQLLSSLCAQSSHPLSRKIHAQYETINTLPVSQFEELPGLGIKGDVDGKYVVMGSGFFVTGAETEGKQTSAQVFLMVDGQAMGYFSFVNAYREGLDTLVTKLSENYQLQVLSGDNDSERAKVEKIFGQEAGLLFNQKPEGKMAYVKNLQEQGRHVVMVGDGLNDAGALSQSDIGIAVSDDTNSFSPACDAILDGSSFSRLPAFISLAKTGKKVIVFTFALSLMYNLIGLSFAVQGILSPVVAAILMPMSSISIVLLVTLSTNVIAAVKGLGGGAGYWLKG